MKVYSEETKSGWFKIYINRLVHLSFKVDRFFGMQSYIKKDGRLFCIEIYVGKNVILCEYDDHKKWKIILALLEKNINQF